MLEIFKKEIKCYKGETQGDCCNSRVNEAVKQRTNIIILIIAIILFIASIVIKSSGNQVFVDQVSFASTITSIILSVIAIWMSIIGERSTSEIKEKILDAAERLNNSTINAEKSNKQFEFNVTKQEDYFNHIGVRLNNILDSVKDVKDEVSYTKEQVNKLSNIKINNKSTSNDTKIAISTRMEIFKNIIDCDDELSGHIINILYNLLTKSYKQEQDIADRIYYEIVESSIVEDDNLQTFILGVFAVFMRIGIFEDDCKEELLKEIENKKIENKKNNE